MIARIGYLVLLCWACSTTTRGVLIWNSPHYRYYADSTVQTDHETWVDKAAGVTVKRWNSTHLGNLHMLLGSPGVTRLTWPRAAAYGAYPATACGDGSVGGAGRPAAWVLENNAVFFVIKGAVNFTTLDGKTSGVLHHSGDAVWVAAGQPFLPIIPLEPTGKAENARAETWSETEVVVVGADWAPKCVYGAGLSNFGDHFSFNNSVSPGARSRKYTSKDVAWTVDPHVFGVGAVEQNHPATGLGDPNLLLDFWDPGAYLPPHQHPCGAIYLPIQGRLHVVESTADGAGKNMSVGAGELRWVRPGYFYPTEFTDPADPKLLMWVINFGCGAGFETLDNDKAFTAYLGEFHATFAMHKGKASTTDFQWSTSDDAVVVVSDDGTRSSAPLRGAAAARR